MSTALVSATVAALNSALGPGWSAVRIQIEAERLAAIGAVVIDSTATLAALPSMVGSLPSGLTLPSPTLTTSQALLLSDAATLARLGYTIAR